MSAQASRRAVVRWNFWLGILACVITIGGFTIGLMQLVAVLEDEQQVPLAHFNVQGELQQLQAEDIRRALTAEPMGSFFTADVNELRQRVEQLAWVKKASLRKVWPDRLSVHVTERTPLAIWNGDRIVSTEGVVFDAPLQEDKLTKPLPRLFGPEKAVAETLEQFSHLQQMLQVNGIEVHAMRLTKRFAVSAVIDNDIELKLGREATVERIKRFIDVLPHIAAHENSKDQVVEKVDLRYDTGAAVSWRQPNKKES